MKLEDFIGIPWKLNGRSFNGTDCIGIIILYLTRLKGMKDRNTAFTKFFKQKKFHKPNAEYLKRILLSQNFVKRNKALAKMY